MLRPKTKYNFFIIGAGVAGTTLAFRLRRDFPQKSILVLSNEKYPLYSRVQLIEIVMRTKKPKDLILKTIEEYQSHHIDLKLNSLANAISPAQKYILVNGQQIKFDKLIIAAGKQPRQHRIEKRIAKVDKLYTLADAIQASQNFKKSKIPVVIGGGLISIEFLEAYCFFQKSPTLVVRSNRFMQRYLAREQSELIQRKFKENRIKVIFGQEIVGTFQNRFKLSNQTLLPYDQISVAIGVKINPVFKKVFGGSEEIKTNNNYETKFQDIFAVGNVRGGNNWHSAFFEANDLADYFSQKPRKNRPITARIEMLFGDSIALLGECDSDFKTKIEKTKSSITAYYFKKNRLVGVSVVGRLKSINKLKKAIQTK